MEIPWLDMVVTFTAASAESAVRQIRAESLGRIDADYGDGGILITGGLAHIKIHASLAFVDIYERIPGYMAWESVRRLQTHDAGDPLLMCGPEHDRRTDALSGCDEPGNPDD